MPTAPQLLNDDGTASMATLLLMSHHGFRRDLPRLQRALRRVASGDGPTAQDLQAEWRSFHEKLHGHHEVEDQRIFPHLRETQPPLAPIIEGCRPIIARSIRCWRAGTPRSRSCRTPPPPWSPS